MSEAIFLPDGPGRFLPSELARGPWDPNAQHGGAPAALVARAFEQLPSEQPMQLVRLSCEFLRPVPLAPLTLAAAVARPGKRVQLLEASLSDGAHVVVRASALRIRREDVPAPRPAQEPPSIPAAADAELPEQFDGPTTFARDAMEIRFARGRFAEPGPALAWFRLRVPLVAGEQPSQLQRLAAAGDFGNGISAAVPWRTHLFINPDLTIYLERQPEGEWIGLDADTRLGQLGAGLSDSVLLDARGRLGRALQGLYIAER